jgi:pimeloyl-ACP methyl ester carboxylesterase
MRNEQNISITKSEWKECERWDFSFNGNEAVLIIPKNPTEDKRWIWRTEFLGAFDQADMAMVENGWYLAHYKISDMYGSPNSVKLMKKFYDFVIDIFKLNKKVVLFGFSRGGLYAFNYAATYPLDIAALYLDAPVLDIRSWPGGMGKATRADKEWQECLLEYGITEEQAKQFNQNPLDKIKQVSDDNIPIIIVAGGADEVVPFEENSRILANEYKNLDGKIELIIKPECGHHPHSLDDVTPIVNFILENTTY